MIASRISGKTDATNPLQTAVVTFRLFGLTTPSSRPSGDNSILGLFPDRRSFAPQELQRLIGRLSLLQTLLDILPALKGGDSYHRG